MRELQRSQERDKDGFPLWFDLWPKDAEAAEKEAERMRALKEKKK